VIIILSSLRDEGRAAIFDSLWGKEIKEGLKKHLSTVIQLDEAALIAARL
jgi:hypothetical protein